MTYGRALALVLLIEGLFFFPLLLREEVLAAHENRRELGLPDRDRHAPANRKFSDHSQVFIPEIDHDLNGRRHGWLSVWNPHVQLGRPHFQVTGTARSYLIANALSAVSSNPFIFYTLFSVLTVTLTGVFAFLFFKSLSLSPIACATGALGLSLGPLPIYWLTFVVFLSAPCWALCILWLMTRFVSRPTLPTWLGLSFGVYSLLATAYTQSIVLYGYIVVFHGVWFILSRPCRTVRKLRVLGGVLGAALAGGAMAAPEYLDLLVNARRSARLGGVDDAFFLAVLPRFSDGAQFLSHLVSFVDPFVYGNPIDETYALPYDGLSTAPLFFLLGLIGLAEWRRLWGWYALAGFFLVSTLYAPAYLFAVRYLGFALSRYLLAEGTVVIAIVLAALAVTHIPQYAPRKRKALMGSAATALAVVYGLALLVDGAPRVHVSAIVIGAFVSLSLSAFVWTGREIFLLIGVVAGIVAYSRNLVLSRPLDSIATTSPLVEAVKNETADGSRFAKVGAGATRVLPPNQEALLRLRSINSYDSVSSRAYQRLVSRWSERGAQPYGRYFDFIDEDALALPELALAGVSTLITTEKLNAELAEEVFSSNGYGVYRIRGYALDSFETNQYEKIEGGGARLISTEPPFGRQVRESTHYDDYRTFELTSGARERLLFVSQQYHPQWVASSQGRPLEGIVVNDFYQGVIVPPDTTRVELRFEPNIRWSFVPQVLYFVLALGGLGAKAVRWIGPRR
ncbi:MAG TPA: hypothetical protein VLK65_32605 [Vicinamibacteria bacterium]|nr:hypothetical protein [Vicinamibacteria bacterium]